jgi:hypothetical protein
VAEQHLSILAPRTAPLFWTLPAALVSLFWNESFRKPDLFPSSGIKFPGLLDPAEKAGLITRRGDKMLIEVWAFIHRICQFSGIQRGVEPVVSDVSEDRNAFLSKGETVQGGRTIAIIVEGNYQEVALFVFGCLVLLTSLVFTYLHIYTHSGWEDQLDRSCEK